MSKLNYRPEIDGLRAVAVLSVIIFHLNEHWLPGGFLGVDIFFVISGFLITKIIINEITNNEFSFKNFYNRRIKRIYPVFIACMAITSIVASLIFTYQDFNQLRKTIELSTVFSSNIYLGFRQGYFDLGANENPVLHIWSLAVEEQYYLIFPALLLLTYRKFKSLRSLAIATVLLFVLTLATTFLPDSFYHAIRLPNVYYLPNLRFPELLVGSLLAIYISTNQPTTPSTNPIITLILLVSTLFLYNKSFPFIPGILILFPCILAALIIYYGNNKYIQYILANRIMVFIGKISYSLYLFHWLFIALAYYMIGVNTLSNNAIAIIILLTFGSSILSYFLLEQPIRKSKLTFKQFFIFLYFIPSLIVIGYGLYIKGKIHKAEDDLINSYSTPELNAIKNELPARILTIGDSHSEHLEPFLNYIGMKEGWKSDILNVGDCIALVDNQDFHIKPECQTVLEKINSDQYPIIFISAFYDIKMGNFPVPRFEPQTFVIPNFLQKFRNTVIMLSKHKKVYVFANNGSISRYPIRSLALEKYGLDKYLQPIQPFGDIKASNQMVYEAIKDLPNVEWVDAQQYLPSEIFINNIPIYADQDHLTKFGSYYMAKEFNKYQRLLPEKLIQDIYK